MTQFEIRSTHTISVKDSNDNTWCTLEVAPDTDYIQMDLEDGMQDIVAWENLAKALNYLLEENLPTHIKRQNNA